MTTVNGSLPYDLSRAAEKFDWMWLDRAVNVLENLPPIEVYEVGEVYFLLLPCLRPIKTKGY